MIYVDVIPSKPTNFNYLTYSLPVEYERNVRIGSIVQVPFRKGFMYGLVTGISSVRPQFRTRPIWSVSDMSIHEKTVKLIEWMAGFYFCSPHIAAKLFLPTKIWNHTVKVKKEIFYTANNTLSQTTVEESLKRAKKQRQLYDEIKSEGPLLEDIILEKGYAKTLLKELLAKGLINTIEGKIKVKSNGESSLPEKHDHTFNETQQVVYDSISKSSNLLHLLHGVTGSGKTSVYLQLIRDAVNNGKQALILLPEISLTPQMNAFFTKEFGDVVSLMHSAQTDLERRIEWQRIYNGESRIVIGARSALFAPFKELGIIIVDESHDSSYKQDTSPRYNAKRVAAEISKLWKIKTIYGSATPNIESYYVATNTKHIEVHHIDEKYAKGSKRDVYVTDLRDEFKKGNFSIFSELLQNKIREKLERKEQVILFVNRRGTAGAMICKDCGYKEVCSVCSLPLTYHRRKSGEQLECHHCGFRKPISTQCPTCKGYNFKLTGLGTEKVEAEIEKLFPTARIVRADRDTTVKRGSIKEIYNTFKEGNADILIGTQMIAKGWDIPNVTLVGVVLADIGLNIPDFRTSERIFQLITQVAGRTARGDKHGEVIIQTYKPENPVIQAAAADNFHQFYDYEIREREQFDFPPFGKLLKLTYSHKVEATCIKHITELAERLRTTKTHYKKEIYLAPDYYSFRNGEHFYNIFIQGVKPDEVLQKLPSQTFDKTKIDRI